MSKDSSCIKKELQEAGVCTELSIVDIKKTKTKLYLFTPVVLFSHDHMPQGIWKGSNSYCVGVEGKGGGQEYFKPSA